MSMRRPTKDRRLKKRCTNLSFKMFAVAYLLFCIVYQLTSPAAAYFTDTEKVLVTFSTDDVFNEKKNQTRN